jgi:hypothetical protein
MCTFDVFSGVDKKHELASEPRRFFSWLIYNVMEYLITYINLLHSTKLKEVKLFKLSAVAPSSEAWEHD